MILTAEKVESTTLSPELVGKLHLMAGNYDQYQARADDSKWEIAKLVNDWYGEHQSIFKGVKMDYYQECSRMANTGLKRKRWSDSGEALRKMCELETTYHNTPGIEEILDATSVQHLQFAKKLAADGKVSVPVYALAKAIDMNWTADEMCYHFAPPEVVHEAEKGIGYLDGLQALEYAWLKVSERDEVRTLLARVRSILEKR